MSRWWDEDVADAGQGLFADPNLALQIATMPAQLLAQNQQAQQQQEADARRARGGFMQQTMGWLSSGGKALDGALSHVPGYGVAKESANNLVVAPVDKLASGAYWLYSNAVSQPLSTAWLQAARIDTGNASFFSAKDWDQSYKAAKNISPAQAIANSISTIAAAGPTWQKDIINSGALAALPGAGPIAGAATTNLSSADQNRVKQQTDKFLYDTDYWRNKGGWTYTLGTGITDGVATMGIDPSYTGLKVASAGVKGLRSLHVADQTASDFNKLHSTFLSSPATKISQALARTPDQITAAHSVNNFFDWTLRPGMAGGARKTAWEIAQHPIWGSGRRVNPAKYQLSELFANADQVEQPMIMRFAMGDQNAIQQLAIKNSGLATQLSRAIDNRKVASSVKYDPALFDHYMQENRAGRSAASSPGGPGIGGTSPTTLKGQLLEAPYPRPTTPGPRQAGWDATYGNLQKKADLYRKATGDILTSANGVRPMGGAAATTLADKLRFDEWAAGNMDQLNTQVSALQKQNNIFSNLLGGVVKHPDDFSPGGASLFGTTKNLYRTGPLAIRNSEKAADRTIAAQVARRDPGVTRDGNMASRILSTGYYNVPIRVIQSFGDRLPNTMINHNDEDASDRVLDMLKQVPGLDPNIRLGMLNAYSAAPDKIAKSKVLSQIHGDVVKRMSEQHNLNYDAAQNIADMIETGRLKAHQDLLGKSGSSQMFAAPNAKGIRPDMIDTGEGVVVTPLAKTQLSYAEPLLNVKELDNYLSRNAGHLQSIKEAGGVMRDAVMTTADSLSNVWKASTLLRPGYVVRAPSEEMAASAVKFGMLSSIMDTAHGGANWARNRGQYVKAIRGAGSYTSASGSKSIVQILDPGVKAATESRAGALKSAGRPLSEAEKTERIKVSKAWPVVMERIDRETGSIKALNAKISKMAADPDHDATVLAGLRDDLIDHKNVLDEHTDYAHEILRQATDSTGRRIGEGTITHRGVEVPQAFSKQWENPIPRDQISSDVANQTLFARGEQIDNGRMVKTGNWTTVTKDDPNYMSSLLDALNKQWGQDDLFKNVAGDMTLGNAAHWLRSPEGKLHMSNLGPLARDPEDLANRVRNVLNQYTAGSPALLDKISKGEEISEADVRAAIHSDDLPAVHGEEIKGLTGRGYNESVGGMIDNIINKGFRAMGTIPTDIMSRNPTYLRSQEAHMRRLIDQELSYQTSIGNTSGTITAKSLNAMLKKSDGLARKEISQIVYDPTRTTATQALRFVAPFMSAQIDGLERWGGLIAEKPQFLGHAAKIYNAPVAANLVTDSQGNHVDENGYANVMGSDGKLHRTFVNINNRTVHMKMPPGTRGLTAALTGTGGSDIPIKIQALNTVLPGDPWFNPGTGPVVSVAASQVAKKFPGMGDFLQWAKVLPYGPQGFMDSLTPKYIKDVWNASHPSTEQYQNAVLQEYQRQVADHANGGPVPDMDKAQKNAKKFMFLKAITSWMSPAQTNTTPLTGTPYQFYADQFKQMQQVDPKNADANFLQKFGSDYFVFSASLNKSIGIAPTLSALNTAKKYSSEIAGDPSLAAFIVGDVYNQGKFSSSAYYDEKNMNIGGNPVRTTQSVQDALLDNQRRLGWATYNKAMTGIDAALIRSGYHSYTQSGAEQFLALKQQTESALKESFPAWEEDFDTTDKGAVPRRIQSFERLVQDPQLKDDPMRQDIPALTQYLAMRTVIKQALAARGASQLSFDPGGNPMGNNQDLAQFWRAFQTGLVASNTKFADVYHRYLSNDDLQ